MSNCQSTFLRLTARELRTALVRDTGNGIPDLLDDAADEIDRLECALEKVAAQQDKQCIWTPDPLFGYFHWSCLTEYEDADDYSGNWDSDNQPNYCPNCGGEVRVGP